MMPVQYWEDIPRVTILANDRGIYRGVLATAAARLGLIVLPGLGLFLGLRRFLLSQPVLSEPVSLHYQSGESQASGLSKTQEFVKKYSEKAIGAPRYPSPRIGLKEALLLLHLRTTSSEFRDDVKDSDKAHPLLDHMVVAAMLMDLILQGRITIEQGHLGRKTIRVTTPLPVGDPDTDALLERLRSSRRSLESMYRSAAHEHLVARLTDQLRKAGYVRLYEPVAGRFSHNLDMMQNLSHGLRVVLAGALGGFQTGHYVATDEYTRILPWQFLYTSSSAEEESIFARVQSAIALHTHSRRFYPGAAASDRSSLCRGRPVSRLRRLQLPKSIYRFYAPHERKAVLNYLRDLAKQTNGGLHDIYQIAKATDHQVESPSVDSPS